jgi:hypothetical protein
VGNETSEPAGSMPLEDQTETPGAPLGGL